MVPSEILAGEDQDQGQSSEQNRGLKGVHPSLLATLTLLDARKAAKKRESEIGWLGDVLPRIALFLRHDRGGEGGTLPG